MKQAVTKKVILLSAITLALCLGGLAFVYSAPPVRASPFEGQQEVQRNSFVKVSGLSPGVNISYKIFAFDGSAQKGKEVVSAEGFVLLPGFDVVQKKRVYHLIIEGKEYGQPLSIIMRYSSETGGISFSGSGFDDFADIAVEKKTGVRAIKADWSGSFNEGNLLNVEDLSEDQNFKLVFQNSNLVEDNVPSQPVLIEIISSIDAGSTLLNRNLGWGSPGVRLAFQNYNHAYDVAPQLFITEVTTGGGSGGGGLGGGLGGGAGGSNCIGLGLTAVGGGGPTSSGVNVFTPATNQCLSTSNQGAIQGTLDKIVENYVTAFLMMGEQLSAVMIQQIEMIGMMLDAKHQLESQRILQTLQAQAHKDYHPSDQMCRFGTFVRSVAQAEAKSKTDQRKLNEILMARYLNTDNSSSSEGSAMDIEARLKQFREVYCDPKDNNNGLEFMCDHDGNFGSGLVGGTDVNRMNKDVNYSVTIDFPLTLNADTIGGAKTADLEDVIALGKNLYWPQVMEPVPDKSLLERYHLYQNFRRIVAAENVAQNTYAAIFGLKNQTFDAQGKESGWAYMKAMLEEFNFQDATVDEYLGEAPSYYAQMEVLTKKIYQHPDFYTNLYDKPANVKRVGVSMQAIELMQQRDHFESMLRREMLISLLVEQELLKHTEDVNVRMFGGMMAEQPNPPAALPPPPPGP